MCANFEFPANRVANLTEQFGTARNLFNDYRESYFPRQHIPTLGRSPSGTRGVVAAKWGLLPHFYESPAQQPQPTNARAETVHRLDTFKDSFAQRRCIIPATAFFEWTRTSPKVRYRLSPNDGQLFAIAGLWDLWEGESRIYTATMITTQPNELISPFHDRMPVMLRSDDYGRWLDPQTPVSELRKLLVPFPAELMACEVAPRSA